MPLTEKELTIMRENSDNLLIEHHFELGDEFYVVEFYYNSGSPEWWIECQDVLSLEVYRMNGDEETLDFDSLPDELKANIRAICTAHAKKYERTFGR